jgi:hypothetical protein
MRAPILLLSLAALVAGCGGADDPTRTTSSLTCAGGVSCTLILEEAGGFTIELQSNDCVAVETAVRLTAPASVATTLMSDACRETSGRVWDFSPPTQSFAAGTEINMEVTADQFASPPSLTVSGDQAWTVRFEDGFDTDADDIVLIVTAVPAT